MSCPLFNVRPSGIHGRGLFANQFIPAGTPLGTLEGAPTAEDGPYVLWLDETRGFRVTNDLRYINHDAEPNAAYFDDLTVAAIADILPGEEITHHYDGDEAQDDEDDPSFEDFDELLHDDGDNKNVTEDAPADAAGSPDTADLIA